MRSSVRSRPRASSSCLAAACVRASSRRRRGRRERGPDRLPGRERPHPDAGVRRVPPQRRRAMPPGLRSRDRVPGPYRFRLLGGACRGRDRPGHRGSVARTRRPGATRGEGTNVVTVTAILDLERAGFTREQVEALARLLETQTVTKADLAETKAELKDDIASVRREIVEAKFDTIKWIVGFGIVQTGALLGAAFAMLRL